MQLIIGKLYKIIFKVSGRDLTFDAKIIDDDETFVTFTDRFNKKYSFNKNTICSVMEIWDG